MKPTSRLRAIVPSVAIALAAVLLLAPGATAAGKVPTLASTPQYKAFVEYVDELRDLRNKATTPAKKATYERRLSAKHQAAVNKANALFRRARAAAKAETRRGFQSSARTIRRAEAAELAELREEYADKLAGAGASFNRNVDAVEDEFDARYDRVRRQIRQLRKMKAKAKTLPAKDRVQGQINVLVEEMSDSRTQEREAIRRLKDRYAKRKQAIRAAKSAATTEVREARQESVENLRRRWNRAYAGKLGDLRDRRLNQLAELETKLSAGRSYIASMPVAG